MSRETPPPPEVAASEEEEALPALTRALRQARLEAAEREQATGDVASLDRARLEMLDEALDPVFRQIPPNIVFFDRAIQYGTTPRLWIDCTAYVVMTRDRRSYRLVQESRLGRHLLGESTEIAPMVEAVTTYVARRLVERERALAARPDAGALALDPAGAPDPAPPEAASQAPSKAPSQAPSKAPPPALARDSLRPTAPPAAPDDEAPAPHISPGEHRSPRPLVAAPRSPRPAQGPAGGAASAGALALRTAPPLAADNDPPAQDNRVARFWQGMRRRTPPHRDTPQPGLGLALPGVPQAAPGGAAAVAAPPHPVQDPDAGIAIAPAPAAGAAPVLAAAMFPAPSMALPAALGTPTPPALGTPTPPAVGTPTPPALATPALAADDPMRVFTGARSITLGTGSAPAPGTEPARQVAPGRKAAPIAGRRRPSSWRIELLLIGLLMAVLAVGVVLAKLRA